jgi:hypothetical protein
MNIHHLELFFPRGKIWRDQFSSLLHAVWHLAAGHQWADLSTRGFFGEKTVSMSAICSNANWGLTILIFQSLFENLQPISDK